jgi:hypothetical protein
MTMGNDDDDEHNVHETILWWKGKKMSREVTTKV